MNSVRIIRSYAIINCIQINCIWAANMTEPTNTIKNHRIKKKKAWQNGLFVYKWFCLFILDMLYVPRWVLALPNKIESFFTKSCTVQKVSVFGVILLRILPNSDWIRRDTQNTDQNNSEYGHFLRIADRVMHVLYLLHSIAVAFKSHFMLPEFVRDFRKEKLSKNKTFWKS